MKTPQQVTADVINRLQRSWSHAAVGATTDHAEAVPWPHSFSLGEPSRADLEQRFADYQAAALAWRRWCNEPARERVELIEVPRRVHGTTQSIPIRLRVPGIDAAAALAGPEWIDRVARARSRATALRERFAPQTDLPRLLREIDTWTEIDFELLCDAASWFIEHDGAGLTPRQVPIAGMHAKWLNTRRHLVATLAGREHLPLAPAHPARVHLTYLDPDHLAARRRRHDCISVGDTVTLPYTPTTVIISENKDTAVAFPPVANGITVEGDGFGGRTAAAMPWLIDAAMLVYWGDIDAAGFEILDGFRAVGVPATSMLMDLATFETYEQFGTDLDRRGNPIPPGNRRELTHLTESERFMYQALTDPDWRRHRRLEQERIPLADALVALSSVETASPPGPAVSSAAHVANGILT